MKNQRTTISINESDPTYLELARIGYISPIKNPFKSRARKRGYKIEFTTRQK